ncbi:hypothetical protein JCM1840_004915 [Sporobolomyces johnsonii]
MKSSPLALSLAALAVLADASTPSMSSVARNGRKAKRCIGTIESLDDVDDAVKCDTVVIKAFTVPVGKTFSLDLADGAIVQVKGEVTFATGEDWSGPLVEVTGSDINFQGNGYKWNGNGAYYWDGEGSNGGRNKPRPMFKAKFSGTMDSVYLLNPPVQAFSIANAEALTISGATVDAADGNTDDLGHNTDGFDISSSKSLTITGAYVTNQDDCVAINDAKDLTIEYCTCVGGHGISIGSIKTGKVVSGVTIKNNVVKDSQNGLRIKTYSGATDASVSDVTYSGNTVTGCTKYGVAIEQDYTNSGVTGEATDGVPIKNVTFSGSQTTVSVNSGAQEVYVLCAQGACTGTWDWSELSVSGGTKGTISNADITGFSI